MAAEDLGDLQAEILEVKHAIRGRTPRTVHGCEDAGYTAQQLKSARSLPHANRGTRRCDNHFGPRYKTPPNV